MLKKLRKAFKRPWYDSPLVYTPYLIICAWQITTLITLPHGHGHAMPAWSLGFTMGIMFMTWLHRMQKRSDESLQEMKDSMEKLDRKMWEAITEDRIRAQYASKQPAQGVASAPPSDLQEYL